MLQRWRAVAGGTGARGSCSPVSQAGGLGQPGSGIDRLFTDPARLAPVPRERLIQAYGLTCHTG